MSDLRNKLIKLAYEKKELRKDLLPLLKISEEVSPDCGVMWISQKEWNIRQSKLSKKTKDWS